VVLAVLASLVAIHQGATVIAHDPRALIVADDPIQRLVMPGPREDALYVIGAQGFIGQATAVRPGGCSDRLRPRRG
jgi:hypothetical protein